VYNDIWEGFILDKEIVLQFQQIEKEKKPKWYRTHSNIIMYFVIFLIVVLIGFGSYSLLKSPSPGNFTLESGGYGYQIGDKVNLKQGDPHRGDIILYSKSLNRINCVVMGSDQVLGQVVGLPGESLYFEEGTVKIGSEIFNIGYNLSVGSIVIGDKKYDNLNGQSITLQQNEYLMDKKIGDECFNVNFKTEEGGGTVSYSCSRFTVYKEAIKGIIVK
jgi:hypothetical protein